MNTHVSGSRAGRHDYPSLAAEPGIAGGRCRANNLTNRCQQNTKHTNADFFHAVI